MSLYRTFTAADAVEYARQYGRVSEPQALVSADEIGDGNLNLVFKIRDREGVSRVIVKQALPYVRCVGESAVDAGSGAHRSGNAAGPRRLLPAAYGKSLASRSRIGGDGAGRPFRPSHLAQRAGAGQLSPAGGRAAGGIPRRRCSTPPIFISRRSRRKRKSAVSPIPSCARSPKICSLPILISIMSAIALRRRCCRRCRRCVRIRR